MNCPSCGGELISYNEHRDPSCTDPMWEIIANYCRECGLVVSVFTLDDYPTKTQIKDIFKDLYKILGIPFGGTKDNPGINNLVKKFNRATFGDIKVFIRNTFNLPYSYYSFIDELHHQKQTGMLKNIIKNKRR